MLLLPMIFMLSGCSDNYETRMTIEGVYYPNGPVEIYGRRVDFFGRISRTDADISQPTRVSEIGTMKYADFGPQHGRSTEVGRLEFPNSSVYVEVALLNQYGRFEYHERKPNLNDWIHQNPKMTVFLTLVLAAMVIVWLFKRFLPATTTGYSSGSYFLLHLKIILLILLQVMNMNKKVKTAKLVQKAGENCLGKDMNTLLINKGDGRCKECNGTGHDITAEALVDFGSLGLVTEKLIVRLVMELGNASFAEDTGFVVN